MRFLGLALYAEGPTDERFLGPLLQRCCEEICTAYAEEPIEVSSVLCLSHDRSVNDLPREARILSCAHAARSAWTLLFVHADSDGDLTAALQERAQPAIDLLARDLNGVGVAVVPVRQTEAWAICDGDALRGVFGTTQTDTAMRLPRSVRALEAERDPKKILDGIVDSLGPSRQRRGRPASPYYAALGQRVSMTRLRQLPAFQRFEADVQAALRVLRILR